MFFEGTQKKKKKNKKMDKTECLVPGSAFPPRAF
jgi:hypothetical protein